MFTSPFLPEFAPIAEATVDESAMATERNEAFHSAGQQSQMPIMRDEPNEDSLNHQKQQQNYFCS